MMFMNEYEVEDAARQRANHPILGPATQTLVNLVECTNRNSDGWPYWQKPAKAASKLMQLIQGDGSWEARYGDRDDVTAAQLRAAYTPLKSLMTRTGLSFVLVEASRRDG